MIQDSNPYNFDGSDNSEAKFAATFNQAAVGMAHISLNGGFLLINKKFCDIVGYEDHELRSLQFQDITHPDDLNTDLNYVAQLLAGSIKTYSMEKRYIRKDGSLTWVNLTVSLVRNRSGSPQYFISVIEDISARKSAQESLRAVHTHLEEMVRARTADLEILTKQLKMEIQEKHRAEVERNRFFAISQEVMAVVNLDGTFQRVNPALIQLLGYTEEELMKRSCYDLIHNEDRESSRQQVGELLQKQSIANFENRYITKDGRIVYLSWTATLFVEQGLIYAIARDVTEKNAQERKLLEERTKAIAASKIHALGRMAAGLAHEINNPLTIIYGQASLIKRALDKVPIDNGKILDSANSIARMSLRIVDIISGLRTFAREAGGDPLSEVPLKKVLEDTLSFCWGKMASEDIQLTVDPIPEDVKVNCRAVQISQVILNFLNNARDAVDGRQNKEISVHYFSTETHVGLAVDDNGPGISEDLRARLFEPFFTTKEAGKGVGLGLSISKGIIQSHHGTIAAESLPSGGARFMFMLPKVL